MDPCGTHLFWKSKSSVFFFEIVRQKSAGKFFHFLLTNAHFAQVHCFLVKLLWYRQREKLLIKSMLEKKLFNW